MIRFKLMCLLIMWQKVDKLFSSLNEIYALQTTFMPRKYLVHNLFFELATIFQHEPAEGKSNILVM